METTNLLFLLANLAVLGLNLKLYTEVLKDKSQDTRQRQGRTLGGHQPIGTDAPVQPPPYRP